MPRTVKELHVVRCHPPRACRHRGARHPTPPPPPSPRRAGRLRARRGARLGVAGGVSRGTSRASTSARISAPGRPRRPARSTPCSSAPTTAGRGLPGASLSSGARSDTTVIAHVSADREHVTMVSVPRDSMVPAPPNCENSTPKEQWVEQQWNSMFSIGGRVPHHDDEGNTGLRMDHFAVVDFRGFRNMVDALGACRSARPEAIDNTKAKLKLSAGRHVLDGTRPWATCGPARRSATAPTSCARRRAGVPVVRGAGGHALLAARAPRQALQLPQRRHAVADDRRTVRPGHDEGPRLEREGHRRQEHPAHHRARAGVPADPNRVEGPPAPTCSGRPSSTTGDRREAHAPRHPAQPPRSR